MDKNERKKALRATVDRWVDDLAEHVDEVRSGEAFRAYLDFQAKFHQYSWHNAMLILSQCPHAQQIAGYRAWQKLGRQVRKGEKSIGIFAPLTYQKRALGSDAIEIDPETGKPIMGLTFRVVSVFDVSQTDGDALPDFEVPDVAVAADSLLDRLTAVCAVRELGVTFRADMRDGHYGSSCAGSVEVNSVYTTGQQAKTLCHELAHEAMHHKPEDRPDPETAGYTLTRATAELEAESVAYIVCRRFALDVTERASKYIAHWRGDGKLLRQAIDRIAKIARQIIDDVDDIMTKAESEAATEAVAA